jgi:hypothetical protein
MYWLTGLAGLLLAVAPFVLGYQNNPYAMWTAVILGVIALAASMYEAYEEGKGKWEYWVIGVAGILAVLAPFILGFTAITMAMWTAVALGVLLFIVGGYEIFAVQPT